jgi:phosphoenolpyruvate-protein kinase (PTS system EI component)
MSAQAGHLAAQFEALSDEYLRERGRDVLQVSERVMRALSGSVGPVVRASEPAIFIAEDIAPADMLTLRSALGFGIDLGGSTSHTAILARSMNVPAVLGLGTARALIHDDDWLILDGDAVELEDHVLGPQAGATALGNPRRESRAIDQIKYSTPRRERAHRDGKHVITQSHRRGVDHERRRADRDVHRVD